MQALDLNLNRLHRELRKRFWSFARLAEEAGIGKGTVTVLFQKGKASPRIAGKIAAALYLSADQILRPQKHRRRAS